MQGVVFDAVVGLAVVALFYWRQRLSRPSSSARGGPSSDSCGAEHM